MRHTRSLTEIGAWRGLSRNLIASAGDGPPVNVAETVVIVALTLQGIATILGHGIVMFGVCLPRCVVPTLRALNIEPTIASRTERRRADVESQARPASALNTMMAKKQTDIAVFTRREMLGITGVAGLAALTGTASGAVAQTEPKRPRIACLVSYWGATRSHADWIVTKLLDGYWWQGAHTPSRVDVASVYIHQLEESGLGQKICKAKGIPIFNSVGEAVTLGGKELAVDGVVIVGEHGEYPTNLKGRNSSGSLGPFHQ